MLVGGGGRGLLGIIKGQLLSGGPQSWFVCLERNKMFCEDKEGVKLLCDRTKYLAPFSF